MTDTTIPGYDAWRLSGPPESDDECKHCGAYRADLCKYAPTNCTGACEWTFRDPDDDRDAMWDREMMDREDRDD